MTVFFILFFFLQSILSLSMLFFYGHHKRNYTPEKKPFEKM